MTRQEKYVEVRDARGVWWEVKEARPTKHGFDVLYGHQVSGFGPVGSAKLIVTEELKKYWDDNAIKHDGTLRDLPIPNTTLKRARKRYGMNYHDDMAQFWEDHLNDLKSLSRCAFATKYDMPICKVQEGRLKILGRRARPLGWWKQPEVFEALLSRRTLADVGRQFGIGTSQAHRLRRAAQALAATQCNKQAARCGEVSFAEDPRLELAA